jgi:hypothetical protein
MLGQFLARRRYRSVWTDPVRRFRTLVSFSETEEDGGKDLLAAARRIRDADLRGHILRHAADERRHASMFRMRAAEVREAAGGDSGDGASDKAYDLGRGRGGGDLDAHGFFNAGLYDELGEVAYVAMLHVAEQRAAEFFELHHSLTEHDAETRAVFESILKDEKYHVAYTGRILEKWRREGRGAEVDKGLKGARASRFMGAWKRLGVRSGGAFSRIMMRVMYWTVLLPFGLIAARSRQRGGWQVPQAKLPHGKPPEQAATSQY